MEPGPGEELTGMTNPLLSVSALCSVRSRTIRPPADACRSARVTSRWGYEPVIRRGVAAAETWLHVAGL